MVLRARKVDGPEGLRMGLVNELAPAANVVERAQAVAAEVAAMPPASVAGVLKCMVGAGVGEATQREAVAAEREAVLSTVFTRDAQEGMVAFAEKRRPRFTGE